MLASIASAAGLPGGRLRSVQRLRQPRRQPQVSGFVYQRMLQQQAAGRPDAPGGLPEVPHQLFEHGVFGGHEPTVHSTSRWVPDRPAIAGDRGYATF
jgi:hypothetical protein